MKQSTTGKYAIIGKPGTYRDETEVIACFADDLSAIAFARPRSKQVIEMPFDDSSFHVGKTIYRDSVGRIYPVIGY